MMEVHVFSDAQAVAEDAAGRVLAAAQRATADRDVFTVVLAGGSTPAALYELLAAPEYAGRIEWSKVRVFFGDERCVAPDHEWSNYGLARRSLLSQVPLPPDNVHRMPSVMPAADAAEAYADTIRQALRHDGPHPPRFDLVLLGMGEDGHTASLFPNMPALQEADAWVAGTSVPDYVRPLVSRVTLTLPVLNAARQVLFLVTGEAKSQMVRRVLRDAARDPQAAALPAARVKPHDGALTWLLDKPAAELLRDEEE
jgi:6-phosphogluconolactonase